MHAYKHILVPTDFSECSEVAVARAVELARLMGARITLLHAWNIPATMGYGEALAWPMDDFERAARQTLDEVRARVAKLVPETDALLELGPAWDRIVEAVKARKIDLVVMGTHGRRGVPRFFLGSVAEKVVRLSPVSVLTVRGPHEAKT